MSEQEYTLEEISYSRKEDCRIMEAVLKNWFQSPKALNFVSPNLSFPFKFKKWVSVNYADMVDKITTIVLKQDDWIIGHISMRVIEDNAHLFHLFIAPSNRKCGLATKLVNTIENQGKILGCKTFSINVIPKNNFAKKLYEKLGYKETQQSKSKWIKMEKKA
ncbi:MAG TPA: GNAT family N-acetyltransferase [Candidatus Marinimicrobia bacterium]|jgi:ribosomal protein S18 acetylase RimI-like enzyme|nr:GNAT family N-acetyltransferase [Candidatus Neomarinimicrobiota bacterium]